MISLVGTLALFTLFLTSYMGAIASPKNDVITDYDCWASDFRPHGGFVDDIVGVVYPTEDIALAMLALREGPPQGVTSYDDRVLSAYVAPLVVDEDISVNVTLGTIYRQLTLNSGRFPTNLTGYRRAMAYGIDKYHVNAEAIGGAGVPMDSYVPIVATEWEVESKLDTHFYDKNIAAGNKSLENAGFVDLNGDGWREWDPDGDKVADMTSDECAIEIGASVGYDPAIISCELAAEGLNEMGMKATVFEEDFSFLIDNALTGDYWVICFSWNVSPVNPPDLMFDFFRTGQIYADILYYFSNATIDEALDDMMEAKTAAEAKEAAVEAGKLLAFEQPMIVMYNDAVIDAFRTDIWEGYMTFAGTGIVQAGNNYAYQKVRLKESEDGPFGGEYRPVFSEGWESTNPLLMTEGYNMDNIIWQGLWQTDPNNWDPIPDLAYNWTIAETKASGSIQDGQKFTFKLYENATWHDDEAVKADDVVYTWMEVWPHSPELSDGIANVYDVKAVDDYTVEIYTNKSGYFEWGRATGIPVLPKHVWEAVAEKDIEFEDWVPKASEMIGSGPYKVDKIVAEQYTSFKLHEGWNFLIDREEYTKTGGPAPFAPISLILASFVVVAIFFRKKR
ncbi:MAG: ABC transporter substrate-binding protein [Promethearchaeota archaeon]